MGAWLAEWRLDAATRAEILRYMNRDRADGGANLARRGLLDAELKQLSKQHQWSAITDEEFLSHHRRILRQL